jgi:hypothetical protein
MLRNGTRDDDDDDVNDSIDALVDDSGAARCTCTDNGTRGLGVVATLVTPFAGDFGSTPLLLLVAC